VFRVTVNLLEPSLFAAGCPFVSHRWAGALRAIARLGLGGLLLMSLAHAVASEQRYPAADLQPSIATNREDAQAEDWAIHAQSTVVYQYHASFHSPYQGSNSLTPASEGKETFDLTLYVGARLWKGAGL
jgi:hypothetical protein